MDPCEELPDESQKLSAIFESFFEMFPSLVFIDHGNAADNHPQLLTMDG